MNSSLNSELLAPLSMELRQQIEQISTNLDSNQKLTVGLCGEFSVGKSSLLNMLLEEEWLPKALEECSALPVIIEYAPTESWEILDSQGQTKTSLSKDAWRKMLASADQDASVGLLHLPKTWLKDLRIIDLPGLGGNDPELAAATRAYLRSCDAIIYLVANRGATTSDRDLLKILHSSGKQLFLGISKWDLVEEAVSDGEKAPDLTKWQTELFQQTGLKVELITTSKHGLGRKQLFDFLATTTQQAQEIRHNRFVASVQPLLEQKLADLQCKRQVLTAQGEEELNSLEQTYLERKKEFYDLRAELKSQYYAEKKEILATFERKTSEYGLGLEANLKTLSQQPDIDKHWADFCNQGDGELSKTLMQISALAEKLVEKFGKLKLNLPKINGCKITFQTPEPLTKDAFLNQAQLNLINEELQRELRRLDGLTTHEQIKQSQALRKETIEHSLAELQRTRAKAVHSELPTKTSVIQPEGHGQMLGRLIGEALDIGMIFCNPFIAAAGRLNKVSKVGKILKTMGKVSKAAALAKKGELINDHLAQGLECLGVLDKLTCSYWCERLGSQLDGQPTTLIRIDEEALEQRNQMIADYDRKIRECQMALAEFEKPEGNKDECQHKIAALKEKIAHLESQAELEQKASQAMQDKETAALLKYSLDKALAGWSFSYTEQCNLMTELLGKYLDQWLEERLEAQIKSAEAGVEEAASLIREAPKEREQLLLNIDKESEACSMCLKKLKQGLE